MYQAILNSVGDRPGGVYITNSRTSEILKILTEYKESKDNRGEHGFLKSKEYKQRLNRLKGEFPNVVIDMDKYDGVDQENEGACSFCAFLNMVHLTKNDSLFRQAWKTIKRSWKKLSRNTLKEHWTGEFR